MPALSFREEIKHIWRLFEEVSKQLKETDRQIKETDRQMKENERKLMRLFEETDRRFKETDLRFKETARRFEEKDRRFKETDKKIKELANLFTGQWGKLIEALVEPSSIRLFQERGIAVEGVARHLEKQKGDKGIEIDLLLSNDHEVVLVEVKTTVKIEHIKEHLERLDKFKYFFPEYKEFKVYGAIAGLRYEEDSDRFAYKKGLFVLKCQDGVIKIVNDKNFRPRVW